jgi:hypothetical protein
MQRAVEKLTGEPLSIDQLLEHLPALKEVARARLDHWAKGAAVLHLYRRGEIVCEGGDFAGQGPHVKAHLLKLSWTKDIVKRVDPHRFSAAQLKQKRCCSGRGSRGRFAQRRILLTNMRDAQLEQSNSPQPLHAEVGSSMDHRFGTTPEITISRYANF